MLLESELEQYHEGIMLMHFLFSTPDDDRARYIEHGNQRIQGSLITSESRCRSSFSDDVPESDHDFPMKLRRMTRESRENL